MPEPVAFPPVDLADDALAIIARVPSEFWRLLAEELVHAFKAGDCKLKLGEAHFRRHGTDPLGVMHNWNGIGVERKGEVGRS